MKHSRIALIGMGHSEVSRKSERPLANLILDACRSAIAQARLDATDVDGIVAVPDQPDGGTGIRDGIGNRDSPDAVRPAIVAECLGVKAAWLQSVQSTIVEAFISGAHAIAAGTARNVLVYRGLRNPPGRYGAKAQTHAEGPTQFIAPYGMEPHSAYALFAQRYLSRYGATREDLGALVVQSRANGLEWEHGYYARHKPEPLTIEEYLSARLVTTPFGLYDCDMPVDGAGAFLLTDADSAGDRVERPAYIRGMAANEFRSRTVFPTLEEAVGYGGIMAQRLWRNAGVVPGEVRTANVYDGFSIITPMWLEALGLYAPGTSLAAIRAGETARGGRLPVNTNGGNLGAGRMHGIPHLMESALQVTNAAGVRQVHGAEVSVAVVGGLAYTATHGAVVFSSRP